MEEGALLSRGCCWDVLMLGGRIDWDKEPWMLRISLTSRRTLRMTLAPLTVFVLLPPPNVNTLVVLSLGPRRLGLGRRGR